MKTAEEFAIESFMDIESGQSFELGGFSKLDKIQIKRAMIGFAKMHCEAQAKAIYEKAKLIPDENQDFRLQSCNCVDYVLDTESILNAYPLDNIK